MSERYYYLTKGRWSTSLRLGEDHVGLIQDSALFHKDHAQLILRALMIPCTEENLDLYFPNHEGEGRCPTLDLMELTTTLKPKEAKDRKDWRHKVGV